MFFINVAHFVLEVVIYCLVSHSPNFSLFLTQCAVLWSTNAAMSLLRSPAQGRTKALLQM